MHRLDRDPMNPRLGCACGAIHEHLVANQTAEWKITETPTANTRIDVGTLAYTAMHLHGPRQDRSRTLMQPRFPHEAPNYRTETKPAQ